MPKIQAQLEPIEAKKQNRFNHDTVTALFPVGRRCLDEGPYYMSASVFTRFKYIMASDITRTYGAFGSHGVPGHQKMLRLTSAVAGLCTTVC